MNNEIMDVKEIAKRMDIRLGKMNKTEIVRCHSSARKECSLL